MREYRIDLVTELPRLTLRRFMDEFDAAGLIPISLIRWELTGEIPDDLRPVLTLPRGQI